MRFTPTLSINQYGHALIDGEPATDAYGHLTYVLSVPGNANGDDIICFDASALPDGRVEISSVLNCETGSFIQDFQHEIVKADEAEAVADRMIDAALDWFAGNSNRRVTGKRSIQKFRRDLKVEIKRAQEG